jgi:acetolactate synthase small subunit
VDRTVSSNRPGGNSKTWYGAFFILQLITADDLGPFHKVPVWAVLDYSRTRSIERELLLCKVSILGPEYFEDQLAHKIDKSRMLAATANAAATTQPSRVDPSEVGAGQGLEPGSPAKEQAERTQQAALESHPQAGAPSSSDGRHPSTPPRDYLPPSEALRQKHSHLRSISALAEQFQGKIVDVSNDCVIVEITGKTTRIDAFLKLVRPYGILESARTGLFFCYLFVSFSLITVGVDQMRKKKQELWSCLVRLSNLRGPECPMKNRPRRPSMSMPLSCLLARHK